MRGFVAAGIVASVLLWGVSLAVWLTGGSTAAVVITVNAAALVSVGGMLAWWNAKLRDWLAAFEAGAATMRRASVDSGRPPQVTPLRDASAR